VGNSKEIIMNEVIRYYFLEGRAAFVKDGVETPLSIIQFHDFILNRKAKMKVIENPSAYYHRKIQDYETM